MVPIMHATPSGPARSAIDTADFSLGPGRLGCHVHKLEQLASLPFDERLSRDQCLHDQRKWALQPWAASRRSVSSTSTLRGLSPLRPGECLPGECLLSRPERGEPSQGLLQGRAPLLVEIWVGPNPLGLWSVTGGRKGCRKVGPCPSIMLQCRVERALQPLGALGRKQKRWPQPTHGRSPHTHAHTHA